MLEDGRHSDRSQKAERTVLCTSFKRCIEIDRRIEQFDILTLQGHVTITYCYHIFLVDNLHEAWIFSCITCEVPSISQWTKVLDTAHAT